jgi:prepilin-type N-terminal cleavage/methylation domain-containing protein
MTKRFGFTLAEVLITLGIIGVVAAMTMPTLMNATNGAQYKAAYKKALSAISQAVTLNVALDEFDFADTVSTATSSDAQSIYAILTNRTNIVNTAAGTAGYDIASVGTGKLSQGTNFTLFFSDGSAFSFPQTATACTNDANKTGNICKGFIDVNGQKKPNKVVKCDSGSGATCEVKSPTDVYPVKFYDAQIIPNSDAARATLYAK